MNNRQPNGGGMSEDNIVNSINNIFDCFVDIQGYDIEQIESVVRQIWQDGHDVADRGKDE